MAKFGQSPTLYVSVEIILLSRVSKSLDGPHAAKNHPHETLIQLEACDLILEEEGMTIWSRLAHFLSGVHLSQV